MHLEPLKRIFTGQDSIGLFNFEYWSAISSNAVFRAAITLVSNPPAFNTCVHRS